MGAAGHSLRAVLVVGLLIIGIVTMLIRPAGVPVWGGPAVAAVIVLVVDAERSDVLADTVGLLWRPLAFLLLAVPLAVLLDELGLFRSLAATVDGGRHLAAWLWVMAALVTTLLNLDAAVVLLTPLYIHIARRHGIATEALAFQPALLACLASSALPVSNLTNLIVAEHFGLGVGDFVGHLLVPTALASTVGWFAYRRHFDVAATNRHDEPVDRDALRRGLPIVAFVAVGFTVGDVLGVPAFVVAGIAAAWAALLVRRAPWRAVPVEAVLVAGALTVLVLAAVPHLGIERLLDSGGLGGRAAALGFGSLAALATNNLPATVAALDSLPDESVWPLLIGVNVAPTLVLTASLSGLLWRDTARRLGVVVSARRYSAVGVRIGLPALVAAGAYVVLVG